MPQTCSTFAAYSCGAFAANAFFVCKLLFWHTVLAHNVRHKYAVHSCRALFWHTMCAASLQRTIVAHCSCTQCAPQVCGAQLSCTVLCATSLRHTVAVHCAVPPPSPQPPVYHPTPIYFFSSLPPGGCEKKCGDGRSTVTKNKNLGVGMGKNVGVGGWYGLSEK